LARLDTENPAGEADWGRSRQPKAKYNGLIEQGSSRFHLHGILGIGKPQWEEEKKKRTLL